MVRLRKIGVILFALILLSGCYEKTLPDNVVATVNGKPIMLNTVQSFQEINFVDFNNGAKPSLDKLRKQYGATLSTIILYEIILQYVENKADIITDAQVTAYENSLLQGYPENEFEKHITENAINVEAWRILLRYQLALELFKDTFIRKLYIPTTEEVEEYYTTHRENFTLVASLTLQVALSEKQEDLINIHDLQSLLDDVNVQQYRITVQANALPEHSKKAILTLNEQECTNIIEDNEMFNRTCLISKNMAQNVPISEAYVYIEDRIMEQKMDELLLDWLENNTQHVEVEISKHLIKEVM